MRKRTFHFLLIIVLFLSFISLFHVVAKENNPGIQLPKKNETKLTFRAKQSALWFKHPSTTNDAKSVDIVETSLVGELYELPKEISIVSKKDASLTTPEDALASYFSATRAGDVNWIVESFLTEEQEKLRLVFKNKKALDIAQLQASNMKTKHITGHAKYRDYTILFVEQRFNNGEKITEALALKKTPDGWKMTNALSHDETFDIVFAAVSSGEVSDGKPKSIKAKINPPVIEIR